MPDTSDAAAITPWDQQAFSSEVDFADLIGEADFVKGSDLVEKAELEGVPFVITRVRFLTGKGKSDFVSLEAVTKENRAIIVNDGSTGIRRQMVAYLTAKGIVDPGKGDESGPENCRYDRPATAWTKGGEDAGMGFEVRLVAARGLRGSSYDYQGEIVTTFYLA